MMESPPFRIVYVPLGMTTFFHCVWSTRNDGMTTFSPLYIWSTWSDYLFLLLLHLEWPTFSHCVCSTCYDPPFPIVYVPLGMTTFFHCIWSTWNEGMTTFSHCILYDPRGMMESPPFPHCIYDPRDVITFSYCIWSTWNDWFTTFPPLYIRSTWSDYLFPFYMIHMESVRDQVAGCWLLCGFPVFSRSLQWRCPCLSWVLLCHLFRRRDGPLYLTAVTK